MSLARSLARPMMRPAVAPRAVRVRRAVEAPVVGFNDDFNRAAGAELSASADWTKIGSGTAMVRLNTIEPDQYLESVAGTGHVAYLAPQQGDQLDQMIAYDQQISASGSGPVMCVSMIDAQNWVGIRPFNGTQRLYKMVAGALTLITSFNETAAYVAGQRIALKRVGNVLTCYQNGNEIGSADIGAVHTAARRSGIYAGNQSHPRYIDHWENRREA